MPYQGITYDHESFRAEGLGGTLATLESITWNYGKPRQVKTDQEGFPNREVRGQGRGEATIKLGKLEANNLPQPILDGKLDVSATYQNADQPASNDKLYLLVNDWQEETQKGENEAMCTLKCSHYDVPEVNGKKLTEPGGRGGGSGGPGVAGLSPSGAPFGL